MDRHDFVIPAQAGIHCVVIPAKAGIQVLNKSLKKVDDLDSRFRGNDNTGFRRYDGPS